MNATPEPVITYPSDLICTGDPAMTLDAGVGFATYQWCSGQNTQTIDITEGGEYCVEVSFVNGCTGRDTVVITEANITVDAGVGQSIQQGESTGLEATIGGVVVTSGVTYSWFPADGLDDIEVHNPTASPLLTTTYIVTVTDTNGCVSSDSVTVFVETSNIVAIPNAFTPNDDGLNDVFTIKTRPGVEVVKFDIFGRWGELIHTGVPEWDGTMAVSYTHLRAHET